MPCIRLLQPKRPGLLFSCLFTPLPSQPFQCCWASVWSVIIGVTAEARPLASLRSEEHTSELQSRLHLVCRLLLEKKKHLAFYTPRHSSNSPLPPHRSLPQTAFDTTT